MYRRILVPLDGSETSNRGLQEAVALAKTCKATVVVLHVIEYYPVMMDMATASTWERIAVELRQQGQSIVDGARLGIEKAGLTCETRVEDAAAARVCDIIVQQAKERDCDLVVMGTHGRRGFNHALIGSDAERVVRMSPVPVLLVRSSTKD